MKSILRPAAFTLLVTFAPAQAPALLAQATQSGTAGAGSQQQTPPPAAQSDQRLPVDLAKIREALNQNPQMRLNTDEIRFYATIIGRIKTFEEIVGNYNLRYGQVPGAGMTHEEFVQMVTPKDVNSSTGITALDTLQTALTSYAMITMVKRAFEAYKKAKTDRERRDIQSQIERELRELERRRAQRGGGY